MQTALLGVFHHVPAKLAGNYEEDRALELVDSVLEAFSSSASLKAAIDPDGSGVFNTATDGTGGNAGSPSSYSVIWGRQAVQMKAMADATDYTRFGAWRVQQDAFADGEVWQQPTATSLTFLRNRPGTFAYSPLPTTQWSSSGDPSFPLGGSATFTGKTVALRGTTFFEGTVEVLAEWTEDAWQGATGDIGDLTMTISGLMNANGDPLRAHAGVAEVTQIGQALNPNVPEGTPLESITYPNITIRVDGDGNVGFEHENVRAIMAFAPLGTETVTVYRTRGGVFARRASIHGRFAGQDADGPLAVLGTYWITDEGELSETSNIRVILLQDGPLEGAFGADRP